MRALLRFIGVLLITIPIVLTISLLAGVTFWVFLAFVSKYLLLIGGIIISFGFGFYLCDDAGNLANEWDRKRRLRAIKRETERLVEEARTKKLEEEADTILKAEGIHV